MVIRIYSSSAVVHFGNGVFIDDKFLEGNNEMKKPRKLCPYCHNLSGFFNYKDICREHASQLIAKGWTGTITMTTTVLSTKELPSKRRARGKRA